MKGPEDDYVGPRKRRRVSPPDAAAYVLRPLLDNVQLTTEGSNEEVYITCVEYWSEAARTDCNAH